MIDLQVGGVEEKGYRRGAHQAVAIVERELAEFETLDDARRFMRALVIKLRKVRSDSKKDYPLLVHNAITAVRSQRFP
jgi:mannose/fructose/N-acetylgalactosamine-specific phosphotransferase system component IIB